MADQKANDKLAAQAHKGDEKLIADTHNTADADGQFEVSL
jgi:hypothetical protein